MNKFTKHFAFSFLQIRYDWVSSLCVILSLTALFSPIWIIYEVKYNALDKLVQEVIDNPVNREIIPIGARSYSQEFIENLSKNEWVDYVIPNMRAINTQVNAIINTNNKKHISRVEVLPSSKGDPLLALGSETNDAPQINTIVISHRLAEELQAQIGDQLEIYLERKNNESIEHARLPLILSEILNENYTKSTAFISLDNMKKIEKFRDDLDYHDLSTPAEYQQYASFRIYAYDVENVIALRNFLEDQNIQTRLGSNSVVSLVNFRKGINQIYWVFGAFSLISAFSIMIVTLRGLVERQRGAYSLLILRGMTRNARSLIPLFQSMQLTTFALGFSILIVLLAVYAMNFAFSHAEFSIRILIPLSHFLVTVLSAYIFAVLSAFWAVMGVLNIQPYEVLYHD